MFETAWEYLIRAIGIDQQFENISVFQVVVRTAAVYFIALVLLRFGKRRFMGSFSAFDILLGFVVGSIMARGATGAISLVNMIVVIAVLMSIHWALATISFYWSGFDDALQNSKRKLIIDGEIQEGAMRKSKLTQSDLNKALREEGSVQSAEEVKLACLERDGSITVIPKDK